MDIRKRFGKALLGASLALVFALPATVAVVPAMAAPNAAMAPVDINTATADQLKAVPGIGDVYAKRIIANRPYTSKDQLVSKGVLPQGVYDKVKANLVAHRMKK